MGKRNKPTKPKDRPQRNVNATPKAKERAQDAKRTRTYLQTAADDVLKGGRPIPDELMKQQHQEAKRKRFYAPEIDSMMYTFGDRSPSDARTVDLMETIVRSHLVELIRSAIALALQRGSRSLAIDDIVFQIRRDVPKLNRLIEFLSWKEVRKNVAKSDSKGDEDAGMDDKEDKDAEKEDDIKEVVAPKSIGRRSVRLGWDHVGGLSDVLPDGDENPRDREDTTNLRLKLANDITMTMTREEYMEYADRRQASFTYKKAKKFRDWLEAGSFELKLSDDVIEVLGYLAWETVNQLTRLSLDIKKQMDAAKITVMPVLVPANAFDDEVQRTRPPASTMLLEPSMPDSVAATTGSERPDPDRPLGTLHLREAIRRLQPLQHNISGFTATRGNPRIIRL